MKNMPESADAPFSATLDKSGEEPLYLQLKKQLALYIVDRRLAPGTRLPDIKTLAVSSNVSVKTVNNALNELIRERICVRRPKKGTFVAGKRTPIPKKVRRICMLYHRHSMDVLGQDDVRSRMLSGIRAECLAQGVDLLFVSGDPVETVDFYSADGKIEIIGIVIFESTGFAESVRLAQIFPNIRFMYLNDCCEEFDTSPRNIYGIFHDDYAGGYQAGMYLATLKPRSVAIVGVSLDIETYSKRAAGFRAALTENTNTLIHAPVEIWETRRILKTDDLRRLGVRAGHKLLNMPVVPDAVFAVNDRIAEGVIEAFAERNLDKKTIFFGYDNIFPEISAKYNFSTIDVDFPTMGKWAVRMMASESFIPKTFYLPPKTIFRMPLSGREETHE